MHITNGWYYDQAYQPYSATRMSSSATGNDVITGNCAINVPQARIQITRKRDGKRDIRELDRIRRKALEGEDEGETKWRQPIEIK